MKKGMLAVSLLMSGSLCALERARPPRLNMFLGRDTFMTVLPEFEHRVFKGNAEVACQNALSSLSESVCTVELSKQNVYPGRAKNPSV